MHRLGDDAEVGQLLQQRAREPRALTVGNQRIKPSQCLRLTKRPAEDSDFGPLAKAPDTFSLPVSAVDVVEYRYAPRLMERS